MENQEIYNIDTTTKEIVVSHKKALDEKEPLKIDITGNIDSPLRFLEKRYQPEIGTLGSYVQACDSHLIIDREMMMISLEFSECDPLHSGQICGKLEEHPDFKKWGINMGEEWGHQDFAEFCKMNRSCFPDPHVAMKLFQELKNVRIKTDKEYENQSDNRGSVKQMIAQKIIASNIPEKFQISVPIFKGQPRQLIEVEIYVNPSTFAVTLVSPQANDIVNLVRDSIIDEQKHQIQGLAPDLVIIEQ